MQSEENFFFAFSDKSKTRKGRVEATDGQTLHLIKTLTSMKENHNSASAQKQDQNEDERLSNPYFADELLFEKAKKAYLEDGKGGWDEAV